MAVKRTVQFYPLSSVLEAVGVERREIAQISEEVRKFCGGVNDLIRHRKSLVSGFTVSEALSSESRYEVAAKVDVAFAEFWIDLES